MLPFTSAYLNSFSWAKAAYNYKLGLSQSSNVKVDLTSLTDPIFPNIGNSNIVIKTSLDWNNWSKSHVSNIGALYSSIDYANQYITTLYNLLNSQISQAEQQVQTLESSLRTLISTLRYNASTSLNIQGGDLTWIDTSPNLYTDIGMLAADTTENSFKLATNQAPYSTILGQGGFAGTIQIERTLGAPTQTGDLKSIIDGSSTTFWSSTTYTPSPISANNTDVTWLPSDYKYGQAIYLTYYLDRAVTLSEAYINPISANPFDLVAVSWTPFGINNVLTNGGFETATEWSYLNASRIANYGIDNSYALLTTTPSGYATTTFDILSSLVYSVSGQLVTPGSGTIDNTRVELIYSMKGLGNAIAGARITWLDKNNSVISYSLQENYVTSFYRSLRFVDFAPANAASGRIDLGIFYTPTQSASAFFDDVYLFVGEDTLPVNEIISSETNIPLTGKTGAILTDRISFIFAQRNPRLELLTASSTNTTLPLTLSNSQIDPTLQYQISDLQNSFNNLGLGNTTYCYTIGIKELDLRYREFIPRGQLVSLPLKSPMEIRQMWVTTEYGSKEVNGTYFYIYPFGNTNASLLKNGQYIPVQPWVLGDILDTQLQASQGDLINIFTTEEVNAGWTNKLTNVFIADPYPKLDYFDGTDINGQIQLSSTPHLKRPRILGGVNNQPFGILNWLQNYSLKPSTFDPNAETLIGFSSQTTKNAILQNTYSGLTIAATGLAYYPGYIPIKVVVETDDWIAYPDTFGRADLESVIKITGELLTKTSQTTTTTTDSSPVIGFNSWLSATTILDLRNKYGIIEPLINGFFNQFTTLQDALDIVVKAKRQTLLNNLQGYYTKLVANNKIALQSQTTSTTTTKTTNDQVYQTLFSPIISGPNQNYINLFWTSNALTASAMYIPISNKDFTVDPVKGLVTILTAAPSGYTEITANYLYTSNNIDNFSSQPLSFINLPSSGTALAQSSTLMQTRVLPITRNMTDYINGIIPVLNPPNFNELDSEYYPVIEYYVNSVGQLQFSRDFSKYGNLPAKITVSYETLGINPRVGVQIIRSGIPTLSTTITNLSLKVREGAAVLTGSS